MWVGVFMLMFVSIRAKARYPRSSLPAFIGSSKKLPCVKVVGEVHKQFEPVGATLLYLLAESHLSVHTFVEEKYCAIDSYVCNDKINME